MGMRSEFLKLDSISLYQLYYLVVPGSDLLNCQPLIGHLKILSTPTIYTEIDNLPEG